MTENRPAQPAPQPDAPYAGRRVGPRDPAFGDDFPDTAAKAADPTPIGPLEQAFRYADDRADRLEHVLGDLNGVIYRAGTQLAGLMRDGEYLEPDGMTQPTDPTPEDRRSTITRRVHAGGDRVDQLADVASLMRIRLEAILDALEV